MLYKLLRFCHAAFFLRFGAQKPSNDRTQDGNISHIVLGNINKVNGLKWRLIVFKPHSRTSNAPSFIL